jgi:hypothetical protein
MSPPPASLGDPMEIEEKNTPIQSRILDRFRKSWFPPAAAVGAFSAFVVAAFRVRPGQRSVAVAPAQQAAHPIRSQKPPVEVASQVFDREYARTSVLGAAGAALPFRSSLHGVVVDSRDRIYALGDGEVRIFQPDGSLVRRWKAPENALCLAVDSQEVVYIGLPGSIEVYGAVGNHVGGFNVGEAGKPADITAIKVFRKEILIADATARLIRRYEFSGRQLGDIGTQSKARRFMLPNRSLDFDVDERGVVRAGDSGRHRVTAWNIEGLPLGSFGKFGQRNPEDFTGCCNPVNIAVTRDGKVVTAEKAGARVKVFEPEGKLLAVIGAEHFDANCTHIHLAVDSKGRILAADPVRREIKIFAQVGEVGQFPRMGPRLKEFERV